MKWGSTLEDTRTNVNLMSDRLVAGERTLPARVNNLQGRGKLSWASCMKTALCGVRCLWQPIRLQLLFLQSERRDLIGCCTCHNPASDLRSQALQCIQDKSARMGTFIKTSARQIYSRYRKPSFLSGPMENENSSLLL